MPRLVTVLCCAVAVAVCAVVPSTAAAWAPASSAKIRPGIVTSTAGSQCTANFVFTAGSATYLGQAAHCAGTGPATETDGCSARSLPEGTPVRLGDSGVTGRLAYSSWLRMRAAGERDEETCAFNDFALVEIPSAAIGKVNPSVPKLGGPTGLGEAADRSTVLSYGSSPLRLGLSALSPKQGTVLDHSKGGWSREVLTVTPGIPGDSGSGFLNAKGQAFGVLSTVQLAPLPGVNGVGDLGREIAYARAHGVEGLTLVPGTEPFRPRLL